MKFAYRVYTDTSFEDYDSLDEARAHAGDLEFIYLFGPKSLVAIKTLGIVHKRKGHNPIWLTPDKQVFYLNPDGTIMYKVSTDSAKKR